MRLETVESNMLHAIGYDHDSLELEVIHLSGKIFRYHGVPYKVYAELLAANSKGRYVLANVADRYPKSDLTRISAR